MMIKMKLSKVLPLLIGMLLYLQAYSQNSVSGEVTDADLGDPLIGVNILVQGTVKGTITDLDGSFTIQVSENLPYTLVFSLIGYGSQSIEVTESNAVLNVELRTQSIITDEIVVSASRKREKVQEAPASISVINATKIATSAQAADPVRNLINVPGVQIQQQSASRINIEMRGSASNFSTSVFPIMDYRSLVGPGVGTFQSDQAGISTVDLQRIEVVRGPGSALYGPGVTSGVVHFITKNPIDFPGTTIELIGGELNTFGGTVRHAGRNEAKTFGYKINAFYKQGNEFTLDPVEDAAQIAKFKTQIFRPAVSNNRVDLTQPGTLLLSEAELDPDGDGNMMSDEWSSGSFNGSLEFRPQSDLSVTLNGGYNFASSVFYNDLGEGLSQATEKWGQARVQKGGLFAQLYYVNNDGGTDDKPTLLYQSGNRSPIGRKHIEGQLQYNFGLSGFLNSDWTIGTDYRKTVNETFNMVYGLNEDDDDYKVQGAYIQGKFELDPKLDLILAARYDNFNIIEEDFVSPRVALVYKPDPKHTFRASYNRASSPPSSLETNIDFPVNVPAAGIFDFWLYGQKEVQSFSDNPLIDISIPGVPDLPYGTPGLPLAVVYGAVTPTIIEQIGAAVGTLLTAQQFALLSQLLTSSAPSGFSGQFVGVNAFENAPLSDLIPTNEAVLREVNSFEIGYKGLIQDKFSVSVDLYQINTKGFSDFTQISPLIQLVNHNIAADLGAAVQAHFQPQIEGTLISLGLDPATAAGQAAAFGQLLGGAYTQGGAGFVAQTSALYPIIGAVETDRVPQNDNITHVAAGYRIFPDADVTYYGADIGLEYFLSDDLTLFGNYSWVNETDFFGEDLGVEANSPLSYILNAPKNKFRVGMYYSPVEGIRANIAFQHDDSFNANAGQYSGPTDEKNLVDASIGYNFGNGLSVDLTATNLFDSEYRTLPLMPKIGRRVLGRLVYTFGTE